VTDLGFTSSMKSTPTAHATAAQRAANRILYIERLARSRDDSSTWESSTPGERAEARIVRARWKAFGIDA
jgi:hypothetical protein